MNIYKKTVNLFRKTLRGICWIICLMLPVDNRKIVISNYYGKGYGDSPKYITEKLLKHNKKIVWLIKNKEDAKSLPNGVNPCINSPYKAIFHLSTAKIWIDNCRKGYIIKKKNQKYLQVWHGFAMKQIEADAKNVLADVYVRCAIRDSKNTDIIISDSRHMTNIYKKSFWYSGEVLELGTPRNDILVKENEYIDNNVREYFGLNPDTGIILYAPTFRADLKFDAYLNEFENLINVCESKFGKKHVVLLRLHPNISDRFEELDFDNKNVLNATSYYDLQELLATADILISDYSSLMFDYMITKRPCFIYATDIENYINDRNFYFDLHSTPFPICTSKGELYTAINLLDMKEYQSKVENFTEKYGIICKGNASEKCVEWILSQMRGGTNE